MESLEAIPYEKRGVLFVHRWVSHDHTVAFFNFANSAATITAPVLTGTWRKQIDSADERWLSAKATAPNLFRSDGEARLKLAPRSFALFVRESP